MFLMDYAINAHVPPRARSGGYMAKAASHFHVSPHTGRFSYQFCGV
jgi:hypothetical protein